MVTITFPDRKTEKRALAFLLGRFSGRVLRSGEHLVPETALEALADQSIPFTVKSKTTQEARLLDQFGRVELPGLFPALGLFRQIGLDLAWMGLDKFNSPFQLLA